MKIYISFNSYGNILWTWYWLEAEELFDNSRAISLERRGKVREVRRLNKESAFQSIPLKMTPFSLEETDIHTGLSVVTAPGHWWWIGWCLQPAIWDQGPLGQGNLFRNGWVISFVCFYAAFWLWRMLILHYFSENYLIYVFFREFLYTI